MMQRCSPLGDPFDVVDALSLSIVSEKASGGVGYGSQPLWAYKPEAVA